MLSLASLFGSFSLVWLGKDIDGLMEIIAVIVGSYNGANVAQDYVAYKANKLDSKKEEKVEPTEGTN